MSEHLAVVRAATAVIPSQLPAFLQTPEAIAEAERFNAAVSGGITSGGFPQLTLGGGKFHIEDSSVEPRKQLVTYDQGGVAVPAMQLEMVIVGGNPFLSKVFYLKDWQEGDSAEPDCSSDNSITPDAHIASPQSAACATCRQNEWGSKVNKTTGKEAKACSDSKRLVLLSVHNLDFKALGLKVPAASLKEFGAYVRTLDRPGISIPLNAVVTRLMFDPTVTFPKLKFSFVRMLTEAEYRKVVERSTSEEVKRIETPARAARSLPQLAAPQAAPQQAPAPAALPAPAPVAPPPVVLAPAPVAAPPAPANVEGLVAPQAPTFALSTPPVAEPPANTPVEPAYPPHVVAAVQAAGGFGSENGKKVLYALMPDQAPQPEKRTRAKKADTPPAAGPGVQFAAPPAIAPAPAPAAPPAPTFAAPPPPVAEAPAAPAPSFASAPAANTVQPGSSQADALSAMLADVLKGAK